MLRMLRSSKGFMLIELIIVFAIIMILFAITIPHFIAYNERQKQTNDVEIVQQDPEKFKQPEQEKVESESQAQQKEMEPQVTENHEGGDFKKL